MVHRASGLAIWIGLLAVACGGCSDSTSSVGDGGLDATPARDGVGNGRADAGRDASREGTSRDAGAVCQPRAGSSPRDLFDMSHLRSLTLADLAWKETKRRVAASGVTVVLGSFTSQIFCGVAPDQKVKPIPLQQRAEIFFPPKFPSSTLPGSGKGVVVALHVATAIDGNNSTYEELASQLGVVVLGHGEEAVDWKTLGRDGRDELIGASFATAQRLNACAASDFVTGNFALALARTNVAAITLLQRLAEAAGGSIKEVALRGGSKEGYATWLASAVDDRIAVAGPGGFHLEDVRGYDEYEWQSGCAGSGAGGADVVSLLAFRDWARKSPGGQAYSTALGVASFKQLLYPKFLLISGDTAMPGMHDGQFFRLGAETPFLDELSEREWRYDRRPDEARETQDAQQARRLALLAARLVYGVPAASWPRVKLAAATDDGAQIAASAEASDAERAFLWWNHSPNPQWNDVGQTVWQSVEMTSTAGGKWTAPPITPPKGEQVAWYVEAERSVKIGKVTLAARDASPVRFLRRLPKLSCNQVPPISCP